MPTRPLTEWNGLFYFWDKKNLVCALTLLIQIKTFYSDPVSTVNTNGLLSDVFPVRSGCRHGTPVTSVIYIVDWTFAEAIRINPDASGVRVGDENLIISLFADEVLLYLNKTEKSIPAVWKSIVTFSASLGYKINLGK